MEKKKNTTRLRLVKTDETIEPISNKDEPQKNAQLHSKFALQMNSFADELDRMIESIMQS